MMPRMNLIRDILLAAMVLLNAMPAGAQDASVTDTGALIVQNRVDSLCRIAGTAVENNDSEGAAVLIREALEMSDRAEYRNGSGTCHYLQGLLYERQDDLPMALREYFTAVREFEWAGNFDMIAEVYSRMGDLYKSGGLYARAAEYYRKAAEQPVGDVDKSSLVTLDEKLAALYYLTGSYDSALIIYRDLYSYYSDYYPEQAFPVLMQMISCFYSLERYDDALEYNLAALKYAREDFPDAMYEITALNSLGYNYRYFDDPDKALDCFREASSLAEKHFPADDVFTVTLVNLAIAQQNMGDDDAALQTLFRAVSVAEGRGNLQETARISHLVSYVYYLQNDYYNASVFNRKAAGAAEKCPDKALLRNIYLMASMISTSLYDYEQGMMQYQNYLSLKDSLERAAALESEEISRQEYSVERTEKELSRILYERELEGMELKNLRIEGEKAQQELELLRKTAELQNAAIRNQELEKNRALQDLLLAEERLAAEVKDREIKDLKVQQQLQESELRRNELEQIRQQQEIQVLTKDKELNELTIQKIRARNIFLAGIVLLALVVLGLLIRWLRYSRKTNRTLSDQRNKIQQQKEAIESQYEIIYEEREKSERLLLNILPEETAAELKEKGYADPRHYDRVTVLFTDFVGFTMVAEKMTPAELIRELDTCFMEFDRIIGEHNLEKIKTIGDAYMCAGGIPVENDTNPFDAVAAALEIKDFMNRTREERNRQGREYWQCRIGIHTGQVVAGVVGKMKFAYDIWGDAVNTASRMESSGEANMVNISGTTYELVKHEYQCVHRGKVYAKNKGEIDMYFVEGRIQG